MVDDILDEMRGDARYVVGPRRMINELKGKLELAEREIERLRLGIQTVIVYLGNLPSATALCLKTTLESALDGAAFASLETLKSECVDQDESDADRFIERIKQNVAKREAEMRANDPEGYRHYLAGIEKLLQAFQAEKIGDE